MNAELEGGQDSLVRVTDQDGIRVLTLNRPERRNALDDALRTELLEQVLEADRDDGVRGVVLTGSGTAFCAGGDVKGMAERLNAAPEQVAAAGWRRQRLTHRLIRTVHGLPKPTVAAVNGHANGLGADLALSCDFVLASTEARIAMSYTVRGLVPDGGAAYYLPRRVGLSKAKELIYSGRTVLPDEALSIGLVDMITEHDRLMEKATAFLRTQTANSPLAIALSKGLLDRSFESDMASIFASTSQAQAMCYTSAEHRESVRAFLGARKRR